MAITCGCSKLLDTDKRLTLNTNEEELRANKSRMAADIERRQYHYPGKQDSNILSNMQQAQNLEANNKVSSNDLENVKIIKDNNVNNAGFFVINQLEPIPEQNNHHSEQR